MKYVKDAFAYAHKAAATLTNENLMQETADPFNPKGKRTRVDSAGILISGTPSTITARWLSTRA